MSAPQPSSRRSTAEQVANGVVSIVIAFIAAATVALSDGPQWACAAVGMIVFAQVLDV